MFQKASQYNLNFWLMFDFFVLIDIGSTEEYWKRQDAAHVIALVSTI